MFFDENELSPPDRGWNYEPARAELLQNIAVPVCTTDAEGWLTYFNNAAAELWGRRPVIGEERWCGAWRIYATDGTVIHRSDWPLAVAMRQGHAVHSLQTVFERPDGTRVMIMPHPTPLRDRSGKVVAGSNIFRKITRLPARRKLGDLSGASEISPVTSSIGTATHSRNHRKINAVWDTV